MRARGMVLLATVALATATASAALLLVPPALAQVPGPPLDTDTDVVLGPAPDGGYATVAVSAGWTEIGTGPFLPDDRTTLVSPDGAYRVELRLLRVPPAEDASEALPGDAAPGLAGALRSAAWSTEELTSGNRVRYTSVRDSGNTTTVAVVDRPSDPASADRLVLVASAPTRTADRYRTVTADLVTSAAFAERRPTTAPTGAAG